jgi:hypothetical protein
MVIKEMLPKKTLDVIELQELRFGSLGGFIPATFGL